MIADFCSLVKANREGDRGKEKRDKHAGKARKSDQLNRAEGSRGNRPLQGQGAIAPCRVKGQRPLWGLGQRPNCYTVKPTQREKSSMAPWSQAAKRPCAVTLRVLRRASKPLFRPLAHCRAKWARPTTPSFFHPFFHPKPIFPMQKIPRLSHNRRRKLMQTLLEK